MAKLVNDGTFLLGELVEGKLFKKTILTPQGVLLKADFLVHARRISLILLPTDSVKVECSPPERKVVSSSHSQRLEKW